MSANLAAFDLNLLVAFEAIVTEGQISRAAAKVGITQPAMSRILRRLREIFEDQLFIRTANGMIPTPRALELHLDLRPLLAGIADTIGGARSFDPRRSSRRFVIGMPDMAASSALPRLLRRLREVAPDITLTIVHTGNTDGPSRLTSGEVELALGVYQELDPHLGSANMAELHEVCIGDRANLVMRSKTLSPEAFLAAPHAAVSINDDPGTPIDGVLATLGLDRHVAVRTPYFMALPRLVLDTDLIAVFPLQLIRLFPEWRRLAIRPVPFPLPTIAAKLIWHQRADEDAGLAWLRDFIIQTFASDSALPICPSGI